MEKVYKIIFWGSFILFIIPGIWAILYEDDMPFLGFIWIGFLILIYWFWFNKKRLLKKLFKKSV